MAVPWIEIADALNHLYLLHVIYPSAFSGEDGFGMIYFIIHEYGEVLAYEFKDKLSHRAQKSSAQN